MAHIDIENLQREMKRLEHLRKAEAKKPVERRADDDQLQRKARHEAERGILNAYGWPVSDDIL